MNHTTDMSKNLALPHPPALVYPPESGPAEFLSKTKIKSELADGEEYPLPSEAALFVPPWTSIKEGVELQHRLVELQEKIEELREESRLKANFVNAVVHDVRSPLTVILGVLDLIFDDMKSHRSIDEQYYQPLLSDAIQSCREITNLVNDMLELSKMNKDKLLELNFEQLSVVEIVNSVMQIARGAARQAKVNLNCKIQANLPLVFLDRKQMHRAMMNLVNNAIKFTPPDGTVTIRAGFLNEKRRDAVCDYVLLSVIDTGEGLSTTETPYVFDAYWQAENGKRKCGTGLGLAIVKRIAVAHGGNVSVRSQLHKGSAFTIMIPVRNEPPQSSPINMAG